MRGGGRWGGGGDRGLASGEEWAGPGVLGMQCTWQWPRLIMLMTIISEKPSNKL